ncbi:MAG: hypothetical protein ABIO81_08310 [Ginsengibacter sp.]
MNFPPEIIFFKRQLLCCLLFFIPACSTKSNNEIDVHSKTDSLRIEQRADEALNEIFNLKKNVNQGDLILRTGRDYTSDVMRLLSATDKTYSHCGIACFENDSLFVYHAIGGEWNPDQKLRRDPFEFFCNPYENRGFGIFRYSISKNEQANLSKIVRNLYTRGVMFDMEFNIDSDDRMYCSEFIYKSIEMSTDDRIILPVTIMNSVKFVAVDNLFINPFCKQIKRVKF